MAAESRKRFYVRLNERMAGDVAALITAEQARRPGEMVSMADVVRSLIAEALQARSAS